MKPHDLYNEIVIFCKSNSNEEIVRKYSRYFKEGQWDAYGLTQHLMSNKVNELLTNTKIDFSDIRETSKILVSSQKFEETSFAIMFYKHYIKNPDREIFNDISSWFETGIRNWAHCDSICGELIFPLLKENIITYRELGPWISATNKFQRRAVPVSIIKLLKSVKDFIPLFAFIEPLMTDTEREVHQGTGWFLREAWKKQPIPTESFLLKWKEKSPRLIYQYACEKMSAEEKTKFKRTKPSN